MVINAVLAAFKDAASCNDDVHIIFRYVTAIVRLGLFVVVCGQGCFDFFVLFFLGIDVVHFQRADFIAARSIFRQVKGQLLVLIDSFFGSMAAISSWLSTSAEMAAVTLCHDRCDSALRVR